MAIQFLPILKALPAIISSAGAVIASVSGRRDSSATVQVEERIRKIEDDVLNTGKALVGLAEQVQAIAQELRAQAEFNESQERRVRILIVLSFAALVVGVVATVAAFAELR